MTKTRKSCICFINDGKQHKAHELDMITLNNHALQWCMTWLPMTLSVCDMIIVQSTAKWRHRHIFQKFTVCFRPTSKEIASSMYNNTCNCPFIVCCRSDKCIDVTGVKSASSFSANTSYKIIDNAVVIDNESDNDHDISDTETSTSSSEQSCDR